VGCVGVHDSACFQRVALLQYPAVAHDHGVARVSKPLNVNSTPYWRLDSAGAHRGAPGWPAPAVGAIGALDGDEITRLETVQLTAVGENYAAAIFIHRAVRRHVPAVASDEWIPNIPACLQDFVIGSYP